MKTPHYLTAVIAAITLASCETTQPLGFAFALPGSAGTMSVDRDPERLIVDITLNDESVDMNRVNINPKENGVTVTVWRQAPPAVTTEPEAGTAVALSPPGS